MILRRVPGRVSDGAYRFLLLRRRRFRKYVPLYLTVAFRDQNMLGKCLSIRIRPAKAQYRLKALFPENLLPGIRTQQRAAFQPDCFILRQPPAFQHSKGQREMLREGCQFVQDQPAVGL